MEEYARTDGLLLIGELKRLELDDRAVRRAASKGFLVRLNRGAYIDRSVWEGLRGEDRYRMRVRAAILSSPGRPIASHLSAAALWGMPMVHPAPRVVHVLASRASGTRREGAFHRHATDIADVDTLEIDGVRVTSFERTHVDVARTEQSVTSVTCLDWALGERATGPRVSKDRLFEVADSIEFAYGRHRMQRAIEFADERSGSPGESRSRVVIHQLGFPAPELQVRFDDRYGLIGIVDFWWELRRLIGEFDGKRKYVGDRFGNTMAVEDIVYAEKRREDRLRAQRTAVARWVWAELESPRLLHDRLVDAGLRPERLRVRG